MICEKCGNELLLVREEELDCPVCANLNVLDKESALKLMKKRLEWLENAFSVILRRFDKKRLIAWLLWEREKIVTSFFKDKPMIPLAKFLSINSLIKEITKIVDTAGSEEANEKNTPQLVGTFSKFLNMIEWNSRIEEDFALLVTRHPIDLENITIEDAMTTKVGLVYRISWIPILESFKYHLILSEKDAEQKLKELYEEYEKENTIRKPWGINKITAERIIEELYPALLSFFCGLQKNAVYKEVFDLSYLKSAKISSELVRAIVNDFPFIGGILTTVSQDEFKNYLKKYEEHLFTEVLIQNLIYSKNNQDIFPLFVEQDGLVFISRYFTLIMSLFMYPFYYKELFDKETEKRSKEFEKREIIEEFEKINYKCEPDITDKKKSTLQIDVLAWKDELLYVVEAKSWDIKPFFESKRVHIYRERDLKGVIDGIKYTTRDGILTTKKIPSLLKKIEYVQKNLTDLIGDNAKKVKNVQGLLITKSIPPIQAYEAVRILSIHEIKSLDQ